MPWTVKARHASGEEGVWGPFSDRSGTEQAARILAGREGVMSARLVPAEHYAERVIAALGVVEDAARGGDILFEVQALRDALKVALPLLGIDPAHDPRAIDASS
jgi:hypothetical protein